MIKLERRAQWSEVMAALRRAQTQNRENNPMQSRLVPARSAQVACVQGTRWSVVTAQPNLILL
ncbi:hypothetical protein V1288_003374 [Bradyrhizobium sp. AZCC 2176]